MECFYRRRRALTKGATEARSSKAIRQTIMELPNYP
ncbi:hypothetical protein J2S42_001152 [Catenuloplanes indicus]|uniref:Uncharacterized protein n=1 Tax=Catenuloplanes indicus TaxID=137267 RepID=A0AAE3VUM9_9ACTN|nr:hypothetical protein [Catenuloplanes indicus]